MPKALSGLMGMRHIALNVKDVERSKAFYQDILGMEVVWQPDPQNAYLSSGSDNLALHETPGGRAPVRRHLVPRPPGLHRLRHRPRPGARKRVPRQGRSPSSNPSSSTATAAPRSTAPTPTGW